MNGTPTIPEMITVHLGAPDQPAENITLPFIDYIKNVASSEVYSTWPQEALRANIYAQISFALNRIYTEWYRSQGYDFDITSSPQYDQKFVKNRNTYEEIDHLVNDIFNDYLREKGTVNPLFAAYCSGTTVQCDGLSQWGTVDLAEQGNDALQIIRYYYGDDTELVEDAPVTENVPSYPGTPLHRGDFNPDVARMQIALNRISQNYPAIPKIPQADGGFGPATENAVKAFQNIFNLTPDGVIGKATWYKIIEIYNSVKRLAELTSEGIRLSEVPKQYRRTIRRGDRGSDVTVIQYFLDFIADFDESIPSVPIDGIYGPATEDAIIQFQRTRGLVPDGVVGSSTWQAAYNAYRGIIDTVCGEVVQQITEPYPGVELRRGMSGPSVRSLQRQLDYLSQFIYELPALPIDGIFGPSTEEAVRIYQQISGLPVDGIVGRNTWDSIARQTALIALGDRRLEGQFPGYTIGQR